VDLYITSSRDEVKYNLDIKERSKEIVRLNKDQKHENAIQNIDF